MMIKYRVREIAKDLGIQNKEVIETLGKYFPEPKKYMTALTEEELDIVLETFTQERNMENFDAYFAQRETVVVRPEPEPQPMPEPVKETAPAEAVPGGKKPDGQGKESQAREKKPQDSQKKPPQQERRERQQERGKKPEASRSQQAQPAQPKQEAQQPVREPKQPVRRVVDTRSSNVNIDKYNEKYTQLADQKVGGRQDNVVTKQKFTSRNQQRRGQ